MSTTSCATVVWLTCALAASSDTPSELYSSNHEPGQFSVMTDTIHISTVEPNNLPALFTCHLVAAANGWPLRWQI
jgi:hypothetical protein